jgi:HSP20 family protein
MPKKKANHERKDEEDVFGSFDDELVDMRERMDRIFEAFMRSEFGPDRAPLVYGFSVRAGEDGEPVVQEFGNSSAPAKVASKEEQEREPLIDIIESADLVRVIVELPGVQKSDIKIEAHDRRLEIGVETESKQFHEQVDLPCNIIPDSVKASYKNGVLEISMKRLAKKRKGRAVQVD